LGSLHADKHRSDNMVATVIIARFTGAPIFQT